MIRAALLQYAPAFGHKRENLDRTAAFLARERHLDLLVLPELFATGYLFASAREADQAAEDLPNGETGRALADWARRLGGVVVGGLVERHAGRLYNSAAVFSPDGFLGVYRKVHLFGEETRCFAPGDRGFPVWETGRFRLGVMICYDWRFPEACRTLALAGAEIVAHPSNFVMQDAPRAMPVRALENRVFTITADRTGADRRPPRAPLVFAGQSLVAAPDGAVLATVPPGEERLAVVEIDPNRAREKRIGASNDAFADRRPEAYRL